MKSTTKPLLDAWQWQMRASCRGLDSAVFFTPHGERGRARKRREEAARAICRSCPVSTACGSFATASGQYYGVWGGRTEAERRVERGVPRPR
ncbi:WhiB family transcriptional regulator [Streptomyces bauhiniae]|uniref:Transcriptional regulator WhiB n=1 Tax=Streptomyces bauhiniae TaxID=2340725 RepID=A0A7K3QQ81_9ACTN|nr:WhiB family transcriptional regulator [Streptomyces bauhiniae]NEB92022.1 WhiB family transcriptional regulator [Streptomyces bauhiniae]